MSVEQQIRERAYHLWIADGCRNGEADAHWLAAERELLATATTASAKPGPRKATKTSSRPRRRAA
jgi:hypothetical protein